MGPARRKPPVRGDSDARIMADHDMQLRGASPVGLPVRSLWVAFD